MPAALSVMGISSPGEFSGNLVAIYPGPIFSSSPKLSRMGRRS